MLRKLNTVILVLCILSVLSTLAVANTQAKYVISQSGNAAQVHFVKQNIVGSDIFIVEKEEGQTSNGLWGYDPMGGSTSDFTLETLENVEVRMLNDTDHPMRLTFIITVQVTSGNPLNGSTKRFTVTDTVTGAQRVGDNGAMKKMDDGSVRITLTGDDDFYVLPANSSIHTYTLTGDWPNQTSKAYYATLQVVATPIT